jgi:hypothetical protein
VPQPLNINLQSNEGRHGHDGDAVLINCYAENAGREGKTQFPIFASDGLNQFATDSTAIGTRGLIEVDGVLYWVAARQIFRVDQAGLVTPLGGLADDGAVVMARNAKAPNPQVAIVTRGGLRFILENDVLTPITDTDLPPPNSVAYINGRFVWSIPDGRFFWSDIEEGTSINALNFATAEADPDGLVRVIVNRQQLYLLGTRTTEVFADTGNVNSPFQRIGGTVMDKGCIATNSAVVVDNAVIWVGDDGIVWLDRSYNPQKISNRGVDFAIRDEPTPANLTAFTYTDRGHQFYVLNGTNFTKIWDASTGLWHDRKSKASERWRAEAYATLAGKHIVGESGSGTRLFEIDKDTFDEGGDDLVLTVRTPLYHDFPNRPIMDSLFVDIIPGVGLNTSDVHNSDPQLMMRYSDDGGKTFNNERRKDLGLIGEYETTVRYYRLGQIGAAGRILQLSSSAAVIRGILGLSGDLRGATP